MTRLAKNHIVAKLVTIVKEKPMLLHITTKWAVVFRSFTTQWPPFKQTIQQISRMYKQDISHFQLLDNLKLNLNLN